MQGLNELLLVLRYTGQNIALFTGGLFAGAAIYISLIECPPRTTLTLADRLGLARSIGMSADRLLAALAAVTAPAAVFASIAGGGIPWLAGGVVHTAIATWLVTGGIRMGEQLRHLEVESGVSGEGKNIMNRRTLLYALFSLAGLMAQYLFIVAR
jgi:hypothetical protein